MLAQIELPQAILDQAHGTKKKTKKQKIKEQANDSSKAYYDVYGQQVSTFLLAQ